jgi:catechol 2,3-dioxygenase-like lactoylglutathione lyase family enzyme
MQRFIIHPHDFSDSFHHYLQDPFCVKVLAYSRGRAFGCTCAICYNSQYPTSPTEVLAVSEAILSPVVTQIGIIVRDIEQMAARYSRLFGLPVPNIIITDEYNKAHTNYMGAPSFARAKLAFFKLGQVSLELIEPIGEPSTWQQHLDAKGETVHHIAFQVQDTPQVVAALAAEGLPVQQQGDYTGGRYTYIDSAAQLGVALELLENFG